MNIGYADETVMSIWECASYARRTPGSGAFTMTTIVARESGKGEPPQCRPGLGGTRALQALSNSRNT